MWIEATKNGKYKACERYKDPLTGKLKKVTIVIDKDTRQTRNAAQDVLAKRIQASQSRTAYDDITFGELVEAYLADKKLSVRESTYLTMEAGAKTVCSIVGKDRKVSTMTAGGIARILRGSSEKPSTVNTRIKNFKLILSWGYSNDLVETRDLADKVRTVKDDKRVRIEDKYLEPHELKVLLSGLDNKKWKLMTELLALSGMRIGEAIALRVSDIDGNYIHITKTFQNGAGKVGDQPKTADSVRDIYIQPELAALIAEIKSFRLTYMLRHGIRSDLLIPDVLYGSYRAYLLRKSKTVLKRRITPHALRHTHVSLLAAQGVPFDAIARRLGHHDDGITRAVYFHVTEKLREKDRERMENIKIL